MRTQYLSYLLIRMSNSRDKSTKIGYVCHSTSDLCQCKTSETLEKDQVEKPNRIKFYSSILQKTQLNCKLTMNKYLFVIVSAAMRTRATLSLFVVLLCAHVRAYRKGREINFIVRFISIGSIKIACKLHSAVYCRLQLAVRCSVCESSISRVRLAQSIIKNCYRRFLSFHA